MDEMDISNTDKEHMTSLLSNFEVSPPSFDGLEEDQVVTKLKKIFLEKIERVKERGKTSQLWLQYFELVTLALHFIQAERMGNWKLHLNCIKAMLPVFHATGHFPYAKACQLYLQDMLVLEQNMPTEEFRIFTQDSFFTIRRSNKNWSGVWSDMVIEQTLMKNLKSVGGVTHGRGFSGSVLNRWICGLPIAHHVCETIEKFCNMNTINSNQHVELRSGRIQTSEIQCKKFEAWLRQHSPFIDMQDLFSLASGLVAQDDVSCYKAVSVGEQSLQRIGSDIKQFGSLKMKRAGMAKIMSSSTSTVIVGKDIIEVDTTQLFQRILCTVHSPDDLKDCFAFELATVPMALFDSSGLMKKTKKAALYNVFNKVPERPVSNTNNLYFVLDGGSLIHRVVWPKQRTFGDVYTTYTSYIKKHYGNQVTVVFDGYTENSVSTKVVERQRRLMKRTTREIIFNESTVLVDSQRQFLCNLANKEHFILQLAGHLENIGISTFIATDDADVHIVCTAIETNKNNKQVVVVGQDVDLLVLLTALTPDTMDVLMLKEGKGNIKDRFYSSKDLQNSDFVSDSKKSILFLHAISGCDTTSGFYGKGKLQAVQLFNRTEYLQDIPEIFNNPNSTYDDIERAGERFIIALYNNTKKEENSLNTMRYNCFNKLVGQASAAVVLSKLPPTTEAAHQHSRRTFHQVQTWQGDCLNPSGWGWKLVNKSLTPVYTTKGPAPAKILSLITCGCNKGCGKKCKCVKANLHCTIMCKNCRGQSCTNAEAIDIVDEEDEDNDII